MSSRMLALCTIVLLACGPEVRARDVPPIDGVPPQRALASEPATTGAAYAASPAPWPAAETSAGFTAGAAAGSGQIVLPVLVYSDLDAEVAARTSGVIARIAAELGDPVRAGQVLAVMDDAREVARLAAATAAAERARSDYERMEGLRQSGFATQAELDEARYQLSTGEAALRVAQVELEHTRVLAPFSGVVTRRHTGMGRPVREGEPLFRVTALQPLKAVARLPERDARGLRRGTVAVLLDDAGAEVRAVISRIAPAVEPGSGTVEVLFDVPRPGPLLPGSSAAVRIDRAGGVRPPQ
jgi:RND family efflux transporter MFP subunit